MVVGSNISAMDVTYSVKWKLQGVGNQPTLSVVSQSNSMVIIYAGQASLGNGNGANATAAIRLLAASSATTTNENAPFTKRDESQSVTEIVTVNNQITCNNGGHTVMGILDKGQSFYAYCQYIWHAALGINPPPGN